MTEDRELYEIRYQMECMIPSLERIANALESNHLRSSVREQIALRFCLHAGQTPVAGFRSADLFLQERDRQRAQAEIE